MTATTAGPTGSAPASPLIALSGLSKTYGGAVALDDVGLDLWPGEVHALMGENGAGKSTLIRVLAGVTPADRIRVRLQGRAVPLSSPADAAAIGLRFVHQELNIVPHLSVAENIHLGRPAPRRLGFAVDWPRLNAQAAAALARFGVSGIDPATPAGRLGMGDRMMIRLAALLAEADTPARAFVLDEPTAALTHAESARLFAVIDGLRRDGAAILYVSHRMDEVMALSDRVTVLRDGRLAMTAPRGGFDRAGLIAAMTGRAEMAAPARTAAAPGAVLAQAEGLATDTLRDLSFTLHAGEVLGVAGLENAGQSALLRLFLGEGRLRAGSLRLASGARPRSPAQAWARGIAFVPRERRREGVMPGRSITANTVLPHLAALAGPPGLARPRAEVRMAARLAGALRLKFRRLDQPVGSLSGGNQQKVLFARAMAGDPRLLLLDDPTRGVDVGARADIHAAIRARVAAGGAVLLTSTDLAELLALSDRILILRDGSQVGLVPALGLDAAGLLALIYGMAGRAGAA